MKKIITISSFVMLLAIVLSSCGVNVVKRQHRGGYYITTNKGYKQQRNEAREETLTAQKTIRTEAAENASPGKPETIAARNEEMPVVMPSENTIPSEPAASVAVTESKTASSSVNAPVQHKKTLLENKAANKMLTKMPMTKKLKAKVKSAQESSRGGDGLSLFWIVILVLLILYLLGVTGHWFPGGLVHVLLIIALVLLILWLLRII